MIDREGKPAFQGRLRVAFADRISASKSPIRLEFGLDLNYV